MFLNSAFGSKSAVSLKKSGNIEEAGIRTVKRLCLKLEVQQTAVSVHRGTRNLTF